jgi:hypothetical protein
MRQYQVKPVHSLLLSIVMLAGGCTTYYQIQDPESKSVYYADDIKTLDGGAVRFTDARTGNEVTVQDSDIKEISKDEFDTRRYEEVPAQEPSGEAK